QSSAFAIGIALCAGLPGSFRGGKAFRSKACVRPCRCATAAGMVRHAVARTRRQPTAPAAPAPRPVVERPRAAHAPAARTGRPASGAAPQPGARGGGAGGRRGRRAGGVDLAAGGAALVPALIRNALVRLLAERGWTDAELAARAGLDRAHLNQVKN